MPKADKTILAEYGMKFKQQGMAIHEEDWDFIEKVLFMAYAKSLEETLTVLEFGAGVSTMLFGQVARLVDTVEKDTKWAEVMRNIVPKTVRIRTWDGISLDRRVHLAKYDLAFVDGPMYGKNREHSTRIASESSDLVVIHDAFRPEEMKWQEKYLSENFKKILTGGRVQDSKRWCHAWRRISS